MAMTFPGYGAVPPAGLNVSSPNLAVDSNGPTYVIRGADEYQNSVSFMCKGEEMLRCGPDGFFVRGLKVEQDDTEAQAVYNSFKEWLVWQQLSR